MSTELMLQDATVSLRAFALESSSPLRDLSIGAADAASRRVLPCLPLEDGDDCASALAAWHALLHWLRYDDEPVVTCLQNTADRVWPVVSQVGPEMSLDALYQTIRMQLEEAMAMSPSDWLSADDARFPGLDDHARMLTVHPRGMHEGAQALAEIALIHEQGLWRIDCATERFGAPYQRMLAALWARLRRILHAAPETPMSRLDTALDAVDTDDDAQRICRWTARGPVGSTEEDLNARFTAIVDAVPERIAVADAQLRLSFSELDVLSSTWANALRGAGVRRGDFVGVAFERSHRMVAAQIAVLKTGAAFVPMDATQPAARLADMAEDTGLRVILTEQVCARLLQPALPDVRIVSAETIAASAHGTAFVAEVLTPDAPAYVIFTSGSTGRPKGVLVSHGNLLNFIAQVGSWFGPEDIASQFAPFTFDASVAEIHSSLLNGGRTVILPAKAIDDPDALQAFMTAEGVTFAAFPPQYAKHLSPEQLPTLRTLMTAGSAPDHELVRRWHGHVRYVNAYGPTETTILSTAWLADRLPEAHEVISIGTPILNTSVRVCNRFGHTLPRGIVGELHIGGEGVTHGYLGREEMTRDRFLLDDGLRWYRSGDLCGFDEDGALFFAGRVDNQIKLRGHRLEPGEVEIALVAIDGVVQAATIVVDVAGSKQLIAFCVGEPQPEAQIRERLEQLLPAWAMPNRLMWLPALPLTANGKTDYRRLREQLVSAETTVSDMSFDDPLEADVAAIWRNVLQAQRICVDDNFIHLGGDSLTALVVISALKQLGYDATSSLLLARPRLGDFVAALHGLDRRVVRDYAPVSGDAPLGPIQGWFFRLDLVHPGSVCQSLVFDADESLDVSRLHAAFARLVDHHDELRARFSLRDGGMADTPSDWNQTIAEPGLMLPSLLMVDMPVDADEAAWLAESERQRLALAAQIDLSQAPLFRIALLRDASRSRVVWVLHHLLVDTISHGILLEDLHRLYAHPDSAVPEVLPGKSIAYGAWARALTDAVHADLPMRLHRWCPIIEALNATPPLPLTGLRATGMAIRECRLTNEETAALLERATACYRQNAEELVLAATTLAIGRALGVDRVAIDIEWHGRDEGFAGALGIDRTIGWFTSVHPLAIPLPDADGLGSWLVALKEARAAVPDRGRDFYVLRYLIETDDAKALFAHYRTSDVMFNFSGVVRRSQAGWRTAPTVAIEMGEGNANPYTLSVETEIRDGELVMCLFHDAGLWGEAAVRLQDAIPAALRELIAHCVEPANRRWTPSDFPLAGLSQTQVDTLPLDLRGAYQPTDMQQTMIRHPDTYQVFMAYRMPERFDPAAFRSALGDWIQRHDCLRTFVRDWGDGSATMLVLDRLAPAFTAQRAADPVTDALTHIEDTRRREVRIDCAPLFSIDTFDNGGSDFVIALSIHHLIHDGWSIDLLINDLLAGYRHALGLGTRRPTPPLADVADLLRVQQRLANDPSLEAHWDALPWSSPACTLPTARAVVPPGLARDVRLHVAPLDPALARDVREASRRLGVTVNSLWLAGYAALLRTLGGLSQVRCGVIQNGRMEEIPGVETITGCCVNTLPLVLEIADDTTGAAIVAEVNRQLDRMRDAAAYPLSAIHTRMRTRVEGELFDTLFNIESHRYAVHDAGTRPQLVGGYEATNHGFLFSLIERVADDEAAATPEYELRLGYDAARYDLSSVQDWAAIYATCMLALVERTNDPWRALPRLPEELRERVVEHWNATGHAYSSDCNLTDLLVAQAARTPDETALVFGNICLSYRDLDARTNQLARHLQTLGVGREVIVGVCMERSIEMVMALHAILKAGGAYAPLDPELPLQRLSAMLQDVGADLVLTQEALANGFLSQLEVEVRLIALDAPGDGLWSASDAPVIGQSGPRELAYVIFTSGSTGKPKAAMNEHAPVINRIEWMQDTYRLQPGDRVLQKTPFAFDVSVWEFFWPFITGATLVIAEPGGHRDPAYLGRTIREHSITTLHFVPSMLQIFVDAGEAAACDSLRRVFVSGEAMPAALAASFLAGSKAELHNLYGPTETAIDVSYYAIKDRDIASVPIGKPIWNTRLYVLDAQRQPLPPGVIGELFIGGLAVGRGYYGQPELTAEKFGDSPFVRGESLYRTGDLARWRSDGQIEYFGRTDHQVKIRGFRIELGEIESTLARHVDVAQALVSVHEHGSQKQLVAYIVPRQRGDAATDSALAHALRGDLQVALPDYMVPAAFLLLSSIPLNANGKADRSRLPAPSADDYLREVHVSPADAREQALQEVWNGVLGHDRFGVTDSFFSLGGDSILAIQVVSAAARRGVRLTVRQVIESSTIRALATVAQFPADAVHVSGPPADEGSNVPAVGGQRLLPIQLDDLARAGQWADLHAQYAVFPLPAGMTESQLRTALHTLVLRHDALRLRFRLAGGAWVAQYRPDALQADDAVWVEALAIIEGDAADVAPQALAEEALASLDIRQGRLLRWVWRRGRDGDSLLWVMHHLVVDGVSWRILETDLDIALDAAKQSQRPAFGPATVGLQAWAAHVHAYAFGAEADGERAFWLEQLNRPAGRLRLSADDALSPESSTRHHDVVFGVEITGELAKHAAVGVQPQTLLIAALTRALAESIDVDAVRLDIESHGRSTNADLSGTVGWFTSVFALRFDDVRQALHAHLHRTRRTLASVPDVGLGYGALRHIAYDDAILDACDALSGRSADVLFNYHGQLPAHEVGAVVGPLRMRSHPLRVNCGVVGTQLRVRFDYSCDQIDVTDIERLAGAMARVLSNLVGLTPQHDPEGRDDTRAATPVADMDPTVLAALRERHPSLVAAYPCTSMQEGLLMFAENGVQTGMYISQVHIAMAAVDALRLRRAWDTLIARHDILRTGFVDIGLEHLVQWVGASAEAPWREVDARADADGGVDTLARCRREDLSRGFVLADAPLMRLTLVRLANSEDCLVWTYHHALIDGWSMGLLIQEMFRRYAGEFDATPAPPYRDYVHWLRACDTAAAEQYWRNSFRGLDVVTAAQSPLEDRSELRVARRVAQTQQSHLFDLSEAESARLTRLAQAQGVSLGTLMLAAWGVLLGNYIAEDEVLFGYTTSGRAAPVEGIEAMVGLFINSLPVRVRIAADMSVTDLLRAVQRQQLDNEEHGFLPLADIQRLGAGRPGEPLFNTLVVIENYPRDWALLAGAGSDNLRIRSIEGIGQTSFGLNLVVYPGERLSLELVYQAPRYDDARTATLLQHFVRLLSSIAVGAERTLSQLSMLDEQERQRAIHAWNTMDRDTSNAGNVSGARTLPEAFEQIAALRGDATALVFGEERWSFARLAATSRAIAGWLRAHGIGEGDHVALSLPRGPRLIAAMLGIQRAGAAYVPMAVDCPRERRAFMLADAGISWTLTDRAHRDVVAEGAGVCLEVEDALAQLDTADAAVPPKFSDEAGRGERTAYIIYTSGTTGTPKGVAIPHRALLNFCAWCIDVDFVSEGSCATQFAPFTFDASAGEIFGALLAGAELHLLSDALIMDPSALQAYLLDQRIAFAAFPPPYLQQMDPSRVPEHFTLLTAGSAPSPELVRDWGARCRYINGYGPTETTILSTAWICGRGEADAGELSIGRPIRNTAVYVVDRLGQLCAPGLLGEIWIGGDGVANGYIQRTDLDRAHFLPDPWRPGGRIYRTGDLGRWREDGQVVFAGRRDRQVKLRGFRIELDEIEALLLAHPSVREAAAAVRGEDQHKRLLAWITVEDAAADIDVPTLLDDVTVFLRRSLPEYMLPQAMAVVARMPLTGNGKIDVRALPEPEASVIDAHVPLCDDLERSIADVWASVLGVEVERIGGDANFFALGGHSLLAMRAVAGLRTRLSIDLGIADLLGHPVLRDLAEVARNASTDAMPPILPASRTTALPLSFAQQRVWFISQMEDVSRSYHIPGALRLRGRLDVDALRSALDRVVARHEGLRARFVLQGEAPVQWFAQEDIGFPLEIEDLREVVEPGPALHARMLDIATAPFDLTTGPLLRGRMLRMGDDEHVLLVVFHHIVMDGWSIGLLIREIGALYDVYRTGQSDPLPPLPVQYADYAVWQRDWISTGVMQRELDYWVDTLRGAPALLELPTDRPRPARQDYTGDAHAFRIDPATTAALKALGMRHQTTLYTVVLAAWAAVLNRLSNQADVVIGVPVANRPHADTQGLVGFFVNTMAVRVDLDASATLGDLVDQVHARVLAGQAHQQLPFEQVVDALQPPRSFAHSPIFQTMVGWQDQDWRRIDLPGLSVELLPPTMLGSKFDLSLDMRESEAGIDATIEYATALFDRSTIVRFAGYFRRVLEAMAADEGMALKRLPMLGDDEARRLLVEFNDTVAEYPADRCIHTFFEAQAAAHPERRAVAFRGDSLSYGELHARASSLALWLQGQGVKPDTIVGLCMERGNELMVAILGTVMAGGAYLPLDPAYPDDRLGYMVEDSAATVVLTQQHQHARIAELAGAGARVVSLDVDWATVERESASLRDEGRSLRREAGPRNLAYVIYTSGSTGRPKGVLVEHQALVNRLVWMQRWYPIGADDVVLQKTPYSFDVSVWEFFWPMMIGASVVFAEPDGHKDVAYLGDLIRDAGVTTLHYVPSMLYAYLENAQGQCPSVRYVFCSGEALDRKGVDAYRERFPNAALHNLYGPTEAAIDVTYYDCTAPTLPFVPIGKPISNIRILILDAQQRLQPIGVPGELHIAGDGLARGYLNRADLTADRFVDNPFEPGARMYRTGDVARWLDDGNIQYLGRNDFQVKIRGFRIEIGEIEACLERHPQVREAVVVVRTVGGGNENRLVAYVTSQSPVEIDALRNHARNELPEYMVPAAFVMLDTMPLSSNGKVDRKQLPELSGESLGRHAYVAPEGDVECGIAEVWRDLLALPQVGRDDAFFEIGGDSILLIRMLARLRDRGIRIGVADVYRLGTLRALAAEAEVDGLDTATESMLPDDDDSNESVLRADGLAEAFHTAWRPPARNAACDDTFGFSAIQRNFLSWNARDGVGWAEVRGRYDADALQQAFSALAGEQDLLRAVANPADARWDLLEPSQIAAHPIPVLRLRPGEPVEPAMRATIAALESARAGSPLAYTAAWLSVSGQHHLLLLSIDHLIWDGLSAPALQRRLEAWLSGKAQPLAARYRDFANALESPENPAVEAEFHAAFPRAQLADTMAATRNALAARDPQPVQIVRLTVPLRHDIGAAGQAFDGFRRWALAICGLPEIGLVLHHHGRRRGEHEWFDHVGLLLDKVPMAIGAATTLQDIGACTAQLQRLGLGYTAMHARLVAAGEAPTLPPLQDEVLFNFQTEPGPADPMPAAGDFERLHHKLRDFRGLMFEACANDRDLIVTCSFRGRDDDIGILMNSIPGSVRIPEPIESAAIVQAMPVMAQAPAANNGVDILTDDNCSLIVDDVRKRYGDFEAVKGVSFRVRKGSCFGILGPNGAGKTTLLAMIEGLVPITSGSIRILGMDVATGMRKIQPHLGVQLQQNNYFKFLTVAKLLRFYQELRGAVGGRRDGGRSPEWLLERLNLKDKLGAKVEELSGGQKQRLSIAIALLEDPDVIFLDEPTSALDPQSRLYTWEFIEELKADGGKTIILTTHYMEEAERLCDEIMIMNEGRVIEQGEPSALVRALPVQHAIRLQLGRNGLGGTSAAAIDAVEGVSGHEWNPRSGDLCVRSRDVPRTLSGLLGLAADRGLEILHLDVERPSLEDVFLSHTGKGIRE